MAETFDNPLKNLLLDKMISDGYFKRDNLDKSTIQTISDLKDSEVLQLLKSFGVGPKIVKKDGGIVQMSNGGDPLLGKLVQNLKNKPKLGSTTETMADVIDALNVPSDTVTKRPSSRIANILKGSNVERTMGPELFEVFKKKGLSSAQIRNIVNVPNIMDYEDDFDGFNKAMKKYRTTALKGLNDSQIATIKNSGFLSGYAEQMRKDILDKGVTVGKDGKVKVKPKYKNAITIKNNKPVISTAFQNKYLDENFDFVFKTKGTATGVKKPKIQSQVYTKIQEIGKKTLNKAQQLNLDFALAQVDKLFKSAPDKAKKILKEIAKGVRTGRLFMAGGPMTFLAESIASDPEFQNMLLKADPNFARTLGVDVEPQFFEKGGPVDMPDLRGKGEISDENLMLIEKVLTKTYKEKGGPLNDSQVIRLALELAKADSIGDKKVNFGGTSEDNINLLINSINMMQGSALEKAKATDSITTAAEAKESTKDFITRGINKLGRMFN